MRKLTLTLVSLFLLLSPQICFADGAIWAEEKCSGQSAFDAKNYGLALRVFDSARKRMESIPGRDKSDLAACWLWIGFIYSAQKQYAKAEVAYKRALAIREKSAGGDRLEVVPFLNNLAALYSDTERYSEAEPLYKKALAIREKYLGSNDHDVAISLNNLALLYNNLGRYRDAESMYKRCLLIEEARSWSNSYLVLLNNLAELYRDQGRYSEAEPLYKKSIALQEKSVGSEHISLATPINNLGLLYRYQGRYADAEILYKRAIAIYEKFGDAFDPDLARALSNLAGLYDDQGRYTEAEPIYKRSAAISEKVLGPESPDYATVLVNIALLYESEGRYSEAEPLHKRAVSILEKALGSDHPRVATAMNNLAGFYNDQGRYAEGEPLFKRALSIREQKLGGEHPSMATSLHGLAALYNRQGRFPEAELLYKRSLAIREKALGANHSEVAQCLDNLAAFYESQGRYAEAEPLYLRAAAIYEKKFDADHPLCTGSLKNLARLYEDEERYAEAGLLFSRALALDAKRLGARRVIDPFVVAAAQRRFDMVAPLETLAKFGSGKALERSEKSVAPVAQISDSAEQSFAREIECLKLLQADSHADVLPRLSDVLVTRKKMFGSADPRTAEVLLQLGIISKTLGGSAKTQSNSAYSSLINFGRELCSRTTSSASSKKNKSTNSAIIESMGGDENARFFVANALLCLGNLLASNDEIDKARDALSVSEKCFLAQPGSKNGKEQASVQSLLSLSESWMNLGNYARSQELIARASDFATTKIAKYNCAVLDARLKLEQADYGAALDSAKSNLLATGEAISCLHSDDEKSAALLDSYKVIIESALSMDKLQEARDFTDQALNLPGLSKPSRVNLLVLRATIDFQEGSSEKANQLLQAVEYLNDETDSKLDQAAFTQAAATRGLVFERLGKLAEAQRYLGWALNWDKSNRSSDGLLATARDCNGLALIEIDRIAANDKDGDADRARYYALEGSRRINSYINTAFPGLSIGQQCAFLAVAKQQRDAILTTCQSRESIGAAYSLMMRWKGLLLESLRTKGAIKVAVQANPDLKQKQEQLESKIRLLAYLANQGGGTTTDAHLHRVYVSETAERERLEREISAASGVVLKDPLSDMGSDGFRTLLKSDEAFIDVLLYKPLNEASEHYAVVAMKSGASGEPQFFDLGKRDEIDATIRNWRFGATGSRSELGRDIHRVEADSTSKMDLKDFDVLTAKISDNLLSNAQLQQYLGADVKHLWLCPEGEFGRVPWPAVALLRGLTSQSISQVDSPREFVFLRQERAAVAAGDKSSSNKILLAGLSNFHKAGLNNLDGALKEVETIKQLADSFGRDVDYLPEDEATKYAVKMKLTTAETAHIATHGFARSTDGGADAESDSATRSGASRFTMVRDGGGFRLASGRNPLSECGIYLAYPKKREFSRGDQAPNILTADEIIGLDLSKCHTVTLSACETGLGRALSGQGVFGLRSAIISAGARSVLMSLWSVPDDATQELMKRFYSNLWKEGMNKQDALSDAQNYIRQQPKWSAPSNWAAWVLVGE
ncbi:MAG: CHAT domain-containing tetratricopeptide repeat protein [Candidatus Obscuribacterales bacterium]